MFRINEMVRSIHARPDLDLVLLAPWTDLLLLEGLESLLET